MYSNLRDAYMSISFYLIKTKRHKGRLLFGLIDKSIGVYIIYVGNIIIAKSVDRSL